MNIEDIPGLEQNVMLAKHTTWRVGGPARFFWNLKLEVLPDVLYLCKRQGLPYVVLGRGSNTLASDAGFDGLVISTKNSMMKIIETENHIEAGAGVLMPALSRFASSQGYSGFEFLIGIPGTIGGGVVMNAGISSVNREEMKGVLVEVDVINEDGEVMTKAAEDLLLGYRTSRFLKGSDIVLRARFFKPAPSNPAEIRHKTLKLLESRKCRQPLSKATAGSTFKQPPGGKPAGWYIERANLKGYQIGGAKISEKHANWIENVGNSSAEDIKQLISFTQNQVFKLYGVFIDREIVEII